MSAHAFMDPLHSEEVLLIIGADRSSTGVAHPDCGALAAVSPELDSAYCSTCRWQCRISGAWFMDLWSAAHSGIGLLPHTASEETAESALEDG